MRYQNNKEVNELFNNNTCTFELYFTCLTASHKQNAIIDY